MGKFIKPQKRGGGPTTSEPTQPPHFFVGSGASVSEDAPRCSICCYVERRYGATAVSQHCQVDCNGNVVRDGNGQGIICRPGVTLPRRSLVRSFDL
ncbi:MAG: hypothetical protein WCX71_04160 [Candidatus Buchananbacteria bacterium]